MKKLVNGHIVEFVVELRNSHHIFPKIIDVRISGRCGTTSDWAEALEYARELVKLETESLAMLETPEYQSFLNYVKSGKWESECFTEKERA